MKHSWSFRPWYIFKLRQQLSSPFKMKNEVEAIRSNCVLKAAEAIEPLLLSLKRLAFQHGVKIIQNNRSRLHRPKWSKSVVNPNPLFTQGEIVNITRRFWIGTFIIGLFLVSEGALYLVTANLFVPGGSQVLKLSVAIFLALLSLFCLDYGLKQHYAYRELKALQGKEPAKELVLKLQNDKRILGYLLITLTLIAILFAGLARIHYLENIPLDGLSDPRKESVQKASKWASWLTLVVTISSAILLGVIKRDQSKIIERYQVYRYWSRALKRRNTYLKALINDANKILLKSEQILEGGVQLIIDLKRIFKMEQEYDAKYEQLNQEYLDAKSKPGFTLNEAMYRKFYPVQSAHLELFKFGFYNAPEIKEKLTYATEVQQLAEKYLEEHVTAIYHQQETQENLKPSANGIQNNEKQHQTL